jgi:hypothetical protein
VGVAGIIVSCGMSYWYLVVGVTTVLILQIMHGYGSKLCFICMSIAPVRAPTYEGRMCFFL